MTISRQELESQEKLRKEEIVASLPQEFTNKQLAESSNLNRMLREEKNDTGVMRTRNLAEFSLDQMEGKYQEKYESVARNRDAQATDRQIKERAEVKTSTAMKLHKKLQALCGSLKGFKEVVNLNYTVQLINSYSTKRHIGLSKEDSKKLSTLKKKAPGIYERFLKLEHVESLLRSKQDEYPDLYEFAQQELERAKNEWETAEQMASTLVVLKPDQVQEKPKAKKKSDNKSDKKRIAPKIDKAKEKAQNELFKSLHNRFNSESKLTEEQYKNNKINDARLDVDYIYDLEENLAQKTYDWSFLDEKKFNELKKKVSKQYPDPKDTMDYILGREMKKILAAHKDVTPQQVEKTVNEYLKRVVQKSEFHARVKANLVILILNTRYRTNDNKDYIELKEKQFSKKSNLKPSQSFSFGSLGGTDARSILGDKPGEDPVSNYGNVTLRFNKDKLKNRVTFVCGNSKGMHNGEEVGLKNGSALAYYDAKHARSAYIDDETGLAPDITACGSNLASVYERARELEKNNWEGLEHGGKEALKCISETEKYFECQYHGNAGVAELDEVTYIMNLGYKMYDLTKMTEEEKVTEFVKDDEFRKMYDYINIVNNNPELYGRKGMPELKFTVWDTYGHSLTYEEVKKIMEKKRSKKK